MEGDEDRIWAIQSPGLNRKIRDGGFLSAFLYISRLTLRFEIGCSAQPFLRKKVYMGFLTESSMEVS
jgi:hypothetical protein